MADMTRTEAEEFFIHEDKAHYIVYDGRKVRLGDINGNYHDIPEGVRLSTIVIRLDSGEPAVRAVFEGKSFVLTAENGLWYFAQ